MAGIYPSRDTPNASNLKRKCWPTAITLRTRRICSSALGTRVSTLTASSFLKTVLLKPSSLKRLRIFQLHRTQLCPSNGSRGEYRNLRISQDKRWFLVPRVVRRRPQITRRVGSHGIEIRVDQIDQAAAPSPAAIRGILPRRAQAPGQAEPVLRKNLSRGSRPHM